MLLDERNLDDKITVQNYLFSPIGYLWGGKFRKNIFLLLSYWCICIICLLQYERYLFGYVIIWNYNPFKQYVCLVLGFCHHIIGHDTCFNLGRYTQYWWHRCGMWVVTKYFSILKNANNVRSDMTDMWEINKIFVTLHCYTYRLSIIDDCSEHAWSIMVWTRSLVE